MQSNVTPENIVAAALGMQLAIGVICLVAWLPWWPQQARPFYDAKPFYEERFNRNLPWMILVALLFTLTTLFLTENFAPSWRPLLGDVSFAGLKANSAILTTFLIDVLVVAVLIAHTGGSEQSAFSSLLFALPALAIFLRESAGHVVSYVLIVVVVFTLGFGWGDAEATRNRMATWLVAVLCLILTVGVGLATRPR